MSDFILVIDEGTTSTRAILFDRELKPVHSAQAEVDLGFPHDGWVEQDGDEIWAKTLQVCRAVIAQGGGVENVAAIGITNQRETTLLWDKETGKPFGPAIIWQDRRTSALCEALKTAGHEPMIQARTGLLLDPYFSATKLQWIIENSPEANAAAKAGTAAFGTVDTFLISRLTGGRVHATDVTNASRTLLMKLDQLEWDVELLRLFGIEEDILPRIRPSRAQFGETDAELFGKSLPIFSAIGDQQAALVGQACTNPGEAKITYGTGAFLVANTGAEIPQSTNRLIGTSGYRSGDDAAFALEGSIFNAGTVVKWLRDELKLVTEAADTEAMASELDDNGGVYFVPAFTGLGAPHWKADARGDIRGLSRGTRAAHIVRAGLEASAYQTLDLLNAFQADGVNVDVLRVDGGMAANNWLMQFIADIIDRPVERPPYPEMTASGAAVLAAVELGWMSLEQWSDARTVERRFEPSMSPSERERLIQGWQTAIDAVIGD